MNKKRIANENQSKANGPIFEIDFSNMTFFPNKQLISLGRVSCWIFETGEMIMKGFPYYYQYTVCFYFVPPPPRPQFWDREGAGRQPGSCNAEIWVSLKRVQFSGIFHRFHDSTPLQAANSNPSPDILCHHTQQSTGCSNMSESTMNNGIQRVSQWVRVYPKEKQSKGCSC